MFQLARTPLKYHLLPLAFRAIAYVGLASFAYNLLFAALHRWPKESVALAGGSFALMLIAIVLLWINKMVVYLIRG